MYHPILIHGDRYNAISAISSSEILALEVRKGTMNGDRFFYFLRGELFLKMQPGPNSVLLMDNCSIHHTQQVKKKTS